MEPHPPVHGGGKRHPQITGNTLGLVGSPLGCTAGLDLQDEASNGVPAVG